MPIVCNVACLPANPKLEALRMSQHPIMQPCQGSGIGHFIEVVLQQFDEQASQHSSLWGDVCFWAGEHHVDNGLGGIESGVGSVPQLDQGCL